MDVFEQLLTSSGSKRVVGPETLEYIGKQASKAYLEKKVPLNESIVKLASQHAELGNEHIRRIAEFANNATFQQLFEKNHDKNIHFDVAEPGVIIRDLQDGGSPAHSGKVLNKNTDYLRPPSKEEKDGSMGLDGSGTGDPESGLADLFLRSNSSGQFGQGEPVEKVASAGIDPSWEGSVDPVNDVYAEHVNLKATREHLLAAHESADLTLQHSRSEFYKAAKAEILGHGGAGFSGVATVVQKVAGTKFVEQELSPMIEQFMRDGISSDVLTTQLTKVAARVINPEHRLVKCAKDMVAALEQKQVTLAAVSEVDACLEKTSAFLRESRR